MLKKNHYTALIKKSGKYYIGLCLELNVCSQGESIEEAKQMLEDACNEYLSYMKEQKLEKKIKPVSLELLYEFLTEDTEEVRVTKDFVYSENIALKVAANV